jgi:NMD protein affecting ribosome stability and mRNA decay
MIQHIPSNCTKCGELHDGLWPLGKGVCDDCLMKNFTLQEALNSTCSCLHSKIHNLYATEVH